MIWWELYSSNLFEANWMKNENLWEQSQKQQSTNWGTRSIWLESSASISGSLKNYLEWCTVTCDRLSTVIQCQKQHKWPKMNLATYTNSYINQWIRTKTIFTVHKNETGGDFNRGPILGLQSSLCLQSTAPPPSGHLYLPDKKRIHKK